MPFIIYLDGEQYFDALHRLSLWVHHVLMPAYGREVSSQAPWCSRWWEHREAVAQLYGLWMAWSDLTGPDCKLTGPANFHRDYLIPTMESIRSPTGPFAGCKAGHREKEAPYAEIFPPEQFS
ncbi:hypothetical protein Val02_50820 [Virgisporangium aliadipatigenens]|uniref:DUF4913 domain-containing protein n=1 Tax=Virgisporangium aliadipatigenens TaxID=741659 RepID=A0A8J3YMW6_9ACTN|nr:DUF4913 domain-containing protein [Virgisporangium aliadipatigenens]GIJ48196.1 hypothetical protein Val02_50820 [Virgisporangium aliadipatigenens]